VTNSPRGINDSRVTRPDIGVHARIDRDRYDEREACDEAKCFWGSAKSFSPEIRFVLKAQDKNSRSGICTNYREKVYRKEWGKHEIVKHYHRWCERK
jgi:hypothetical protein